MEFLNKCRTCLESKNQKSFTCIANNCYLEKSFKDVIIMLVPETKETLNNVDCICENCTETLQRCAALIQKCLVIETTLKMCRNLQTGDCSQADLFDKVQPNETKTINVVSDHDAEVDVANEIFDIPNVILLTDSTYNPAVPKIIEPNFPEVDIVLQNDIEQESINNDCYIIDDCVDPRVTLLDNIGEHNAVISLDGGDLDAMAKQVTNLTENGINISDISQQGFSKKKRILLISSVLPSRCSMCLKSLKYARHVCKKRFVNQDKIKTKKVEKCPKCDKIIGVGFLYRHLKTHERDERDNSQNRKRQADLTYETWLNLEEQFERHVKPHPPFVCDQCDKVFFKKDSLRAHKVTHNDPNSYICEICGKGFKDKERLHIHQQIHGDKKYQCPSCPKLFKQKCKVARHVKQVHEKVRDCQCTQCGKLYANTTSLATHMRLVHSNEKPFQCNICQRRFGSANYLRTHILTHTGERSVSGIPQEQRRKRYRYNIEDKWQPALCKFCGKLFENMIKLRRHIQTHVKRYPCKFCPLTFSRQALCDTHEKIHEGGRVNFFRCNVCWKRLSTKEALDEHVTIHNKPRHCCNLCGKQFNRLFLLNHHKLMEHNDISNDELAEKIIYDSLL